MKELVNRLRSFLTDEDGPTTTEYAVMLAVVIVVALTAIQTLGTSGTGMRVHPGPDSRPLPPPGCMHFVRSVA